MSKDDEIMEYVFGAALAIAGGALLYVGGKKAFPVLADKVGDYIGSLIDKVAGDAVNALIG